ncbi:MAG: UDP-N-acetylmuramoyl-tripeptide--D-alanyl-D-alanine ligase [Bdellovibrio sp.]
MIHLLKKFREFPDFGVWPEGTLEISTDSRTVSDKNFFWCLVGAKFDAFQFAINAASQKCPLIVYQKSEANELLAREIHEKFGTCLLGLSDTTVGLQQLAHLYRQELGKNGVKVIGVAGSNGKTTTKEVLRSLFTNLNLKVTATEKNNNNHIGVPLTILSAKTDDDVLVLEFGSNHPGEMEVLCNVSDVDAGIITNIGDTHLEFFDTRENVLREEGEILFRMQRQSKGTIIVPKEDPLLAPLIDDQLCFAVDDIKWEKHVVDFDFLNKRISLKNDHIYGRHNFINLVLAYALVSKLKLASDDQLIAACSKVQLPKNNRSEFIKVDQCTVFLDAYNANPSSMKAALNLFNSWCQDHSIDVDQRAYVLGDMYELGPKEGEFHRDIGIFVKSFGSKDVIFVGKFAPDYRKGFELGDCFSSPKELKDRWKRLIKTKKAIFVKGSRGIKLESLLSENENSTGH